MQRYPIPVYTMSDFASYGGLSTFARTKGAKDKEERKPRGKFGQAMDAARGAAGRVGSAMGSMPTGGKVAAGAALAGGAGALALNKYGGIYGMRGGAVRARANLGGLGSATKDRLSQLGKSIMANKGKVAAGAGLLAAAGGAGAYALNRMKKNKAKKAEATASQARESAERKKFGPAYGAVQAYRNRTGRK